VLTATTRELSDITGSHPAEAWKLVVGQYKTHKGWRVKNET
jgi:predicted transcriptional regulator